MATKCENCKTKSELIKGTNKGDNFASECMLEIRQQSRRWFIMFLVVLFLWFSTIGGFLLYLNQYDFSGTTEETTYQQDGSGTNIIGDDNEVDNGTETND